MTMICKYFYFLHQKVASYCTVTSSRYCQQTASSRKNEALKSCVCIFLFSELVCNNWTSRMNWRSLTAAKLHLQTLCHLRRVSLTLRSAPAWCACCPSLSPWLANCIIIMADGLQLLRQLIRPYWSTKVNMSNIPLLHPTALHRSWCDLWMFLSTLKSCYSGDNWKWFGFWMEI